MMSSSTFFCRTCSFGVVRKRRSSPPFFFRGPTAAGGAASAAAPLRRLLFVVVPAVLLLLMLVSYNSCTGGPVVRPVQNAKIFPPVFFAKSGRKNLSRTGVVRGRIIEAGGWWLVVVVSREFSTQLNSV